MPTIEIDFFTDFGHILECWLTELDITFKPGLTIDKLIPIYVNMRAREIPVRPRKVLIAKGMMAPPTVWETAGLDLLREKFMNGEDVNPHRSDKAVNARKKQFNDALLNAWGIHHFHLGYVKPGERFSTRSEHLVFAMVRPDVVYFIDVMPHKYEGTGLAPWTDVELLEKVAENWPEVLAPHRARGFEGDSLTPEQHAVLRHKGGNTVVRLRNGESYYPPGGGTVANGLALASIFETQRMFHVLKTWEERVRNDVDFVSAYASIDKSVPDPLRLALKYDQDDGFYAFEEENKVAVKFGRP